MENINNSKSLKKLESLDTTDIKKFDISGFYYCKCVSVYDGDTITVVFDPFMKGKFNSFKIRLDNIDTPELRTKNKEEKKAGYEVKHYLADLILNKIIIIECKGFDKYGRILAVVFHKEKNINELLVNTNQAYIYGGKGKTSFPFGKWVS